MPDDNTAMPATPTTRDLEPGSDGKQQDPPAKELRPVTLAIIGAGERGSMYGRYALEHPTLAKVVSVAEPRPNRRVDFAALHDLGPDLVFATAEDLIARPVAVAQAAIVCTQDSSHADIVVALAARGYHILCEKPMATTIEDCKRMTEAVERAGVIFGMGHVLRYSPYTVALKEVLDSGCIGDIVNIQHTEPVGHYHFAHSYVRGNWAKESESSFSLMTKSCHDLDLILHLLPTARREINRVSSFGNLTHFNRRSKPSEAGDAKRCLDCPLASTCAYSATRIYLDRARAGSAGWPVSVVVGDDARANTPVRDLEDLVRAKLRDGPYGRCVYECENDVADHQVVNIELDGGRVTASFTMVAFTESICQRRTWIHGTKGEIEGDMQTFNVVEFETRKRSRIDPRSSLGGHGGGDFGLAAAFVEAVAGKGQERLGCTVQDVLKSHMLVFAAEEARRKGVVVNM
ncbi:hypothetical protein HK101_007923 [Irineochytrium annulatum]|nr:hypothetical protein HK101_007923 [Irineochytrium annulatum]